MTDKSTHPFSDEVKSKLKSNGTYLAGGIFAGMIFSSLAMTAAQEANEGRDNVATTVRNNVAASFETVYMPLTNKLSLDEITALGQTNEAVGIFSGCLQDQWNVSARNVTLENNTLSAPSSTVTLDQNQLYACFEEGNLKAASTRYENSLNGLNSTMSFYGVFAMAGFGLAGFNGMSAASTLARQGTAWAKNRKNARGTDAPEPEAPSV